MVNNNVMAIVEELAEDSLRANDTRSRPPSPRRSRLEILSEVRRRVRAELTKLNQIRQRRRESVAASLSGGRGRAAAAAQRVDRRAQVVREQLSRRIRRKLTGEEDRRVRDYVREILEEPPVVRLRDKLSFLLGVVGCFVVEAVALQRPQQFWICYCIFMMPLLLLRCYLYKRIGWHYFLIDFCYASNACCLVQLLCYPTSKTLFHANFLLTTGPLAMAVPTWRNSLVFHSLDRVTSSFVHTLPPLLTFCLRWFPPDGLAPLDDELPFIHSIKNALVFYAGWQAYYLLHTEWLFPPSPLLDTSIRVLAAGKKDVQPPHCYSGITRMTYTSCRKLGVMRSEERFDSEHWKTKVIFVSVQLLYTFATLILAFYCWASFQAHLFYLLSILACCIWNGGEPLRTVPLFSSAALHNALHSL